MQRKSWSLEPREGAYQLLLTAEQLFAQEGFEAVSTRKVSREAGQKNHSALQYHFGNKEGLLSAILDYRIKPINELRERRLNDLLSRSRAPTVNGLVAAFVEPFSEQLRNPVEQTAYLSLLAQLFSYRRGRELYNKHSEMNRALHDISEQLINCLDSCPLPVMHMRLQLMGRQSILAVAEWDDLRRAARKPMSEEIRVWRTRQLIQYIAGGLEASWDSEPQS